MNEIELKNKLIEVYDTISNLASGLMAKGCDSAETGNKRAEALSAMRKAAETIKEIAYGIY